MSGFTKKETEILKVALDDRIQYLIWTREASFNRPNSAHYKNKGVYNRLTKQIEAIENLSQKL